MSRRLVDVLPEFAGELRGLLADEGDLLPTVDSLEIVDLCRCGEASCSSFYTMTPPNGAWGPGHENVALEPEQGMIILDVIDRKIGMIEILGRNDIRLSLDAVIK